VDFSLIDHFVKVTDKDSAVMTRRLAKEEGLFVGWSCGSAVYGALEYAKANLKETDVMVIILPDHGTRYLNKIYNDTWMKDRGFLEKRTFSTAGEIIKARTGSKLVTIDVDMRVGDAVKLLASEGISQIPVTEKEHYVGSLVDSKVLMRLIEEPEIKEARVGDIMDAPFRFVASDNTLDVLSSLIDRDNRALLVRDTDNRVHILTQADLLLAISQ
jgi:cystathionine beta-synthase